MRWTKRKLVEWARVEGVEGLAAIKKLTGEQFRIKMHSIRTKGRKKVRDFVLPRLKELQLRREARLRSEGIEQPDVRSLIDWRALEAKAQWSNLQLYYELFGQHPTWGVGERTIVQARETGTTSEDVEDDSSACDDDDDGDQWLPGGSNMSKTKQRQLAAMKRRHGSGRDAPPQKVATPSEIRSRGPPRLSPQEHKLLVPLLSS